MYELRVLSGARAGAALPLDFKPYLIGARGDFDLLLTDASIAEHHATLWHRASGWFLTPADGDIHTAHDERIQDWIDLAPGDCIRLGEVWLTLAEQGAPWKEPAADSAAAKAGELTLDNVMVEPVLQRRGLRAWPNALSGRLSPALLKMSLQRHGRRMISAPLMVLAIICAATAYAMTAKYVTGQNHENTEMAANASDARLSADRTSYLSGIGSTSNSAQLRDEFQRQLAEERILDRFELALNDGAWSMKAQLDDEESARFERILVRFLHTYRINFPVHAKILGVEDMLPFKVRLVVSGKNPSIVTKDGQRLRIGDEYQGVRLVAVRNHSVTFAGKRRIIMKW